MGETGCGKTRLLRYLCQVHASAYDKRVQNLLCLKVCNDNFYFFGITHPMSFIAYFTGRRTLYIIILVIPCRGYPFTGTSSTASNVVQ